jgi:Raf kinase inhibitor-like YbhB/YbcL family protein
VQSLFRNQHSPPAISRNLAALDRAVPRGRQHDREVTFHQDQNRVRGGLRDEPDSSPACQDGKFDLDSRMWSYNQSTSHGRHQPGLVSDQRGKMMTLIVKSAAFTAGQPIPRRHTGDGEDLSPALSWSGLPSTARELALIADDPDAPTSEPWVHWVVYTMPATLDGLPEGVPPIPHPASPAGVAQGRNSWKAAGYRGPAPPKGHGVHRYFFKLYALDRTLELPEGLDKAGLEKAMKGHILAQAELMGTYER